MKQLIEPSNENLQHEYEPNNIGRFAIIVYNGKCYTANVLDLVFETTHPKCVRIQYDPELQGKVLMPSQYEFKEWADSDE